MSKKVLLATGGYDHTVRFWEAASGVCYRTLQFNESHVNRLTFSPDRLNVAVAGSPRIVVFDAASNLPNPVLALDGHRGNVVSVGYEAHGNWLYSGSDDGTLRTWDPRSGKQAHHFRNRSPLTGVVLHPSQREILSCDDAGNVRVWDLVANRLNRELTPQHDVPLCSMDVSPGGDLLAASSFRGHCFVWRLDKMAHERERPAEPIGTAAAPAEAGGPGGDASGAANGVASGAFRDGIAGTDSGDAPAAAGAAPSPAHGAPPNEPHAHAAQQTQQTREREARHEAATSSPADGAAPLRFRPLTMWQVHTRYILRTVFSPNGRMLATALDSGCVRLWNVGDTSGEPWEQQRYLGRHQKWTWDAMFSENSEFLFTASSDKKACLWDLSSGSVIRTYEGHKNALTALAVGVTVDG